MGKLTVKVVNGRDMVSRDKNGFSDPYVILQCNEIEKKTKKVKKTLNPDWNETFEFEPVNERQGLYISVFDHDKVGKDDPMGTTKYMIHDVESDGVMKSVTLPMEGVESGTITLELTTHGVFDA